MTETTGAAWTEQTLPFQGILLAGGRQEAGQLNVIAPGSIKFEPAVEYGSEGHRRHKDGGHEGPCIQTPEAGSPGSGLQQACPPRPLVGYALGLP
ncbi:unnamed protein product [Ranitomeya imitator]|uniref:Uncharacterized protein n=1 Tax=Ranitomeya imitator TaxID=111125 RepID=A0ABN9LLW5_9NEOB|nr:unnamed protein product [Ranitomeya imitator]